MDIEFPMHAIQKRGLIFIIAPHIKCDCTEVGGSYSYNDV